MAVSQRPRRLRPQPPRLPNLPDTGVTTPSVAKKPARRPVGFERLPSAVPTPQRPKDRQFPSLGGAQEFGEGNAQIPGVDTSGFSMLSSDPAHMVLAGTPDTGEPRPSLTSPESEIGFMTRAAGAQDPFGLYESSYPTPMMPKSPGWQAFKEQLPFTDKPYMQARTQGQRAATEIASEVPLAGGLLERGIGFGQVLGNIGEQQGATEATASLAGPAGERAPLAYVPDFAYKSGQQDWATDPTAANAFLGGATGGALGTRTASPGPIGGTLATVGGQAAELTGFPGLSSLVSRLIRGGGAALNMEDPNDLRAAEMMRAEGASLSGGLGGGGGAGKERGFTMTDQALRESFGVPPGEVTNPAMHDYTAVLDYGGNLEGGGLASSGPGYTPELYTQEYLRNAQAGATGSTSPTSAVNLVKDRAMAPLPYAPAMQSPVPTNYYTPPPAPAPWYGGDITSLSNFGYMHKGGMVEGEPGAEVSGTLLAGEMVMNPEAVELFGPMLKKMNRMGFSKLG